MFEDLREFIIRSLLNSVRRGDHNHLMVMRYLSPGDMQEFSLEQAGLVVGYLFTIIERFATAENLFETVSEKSEDGDEYSFEKIDLSCFAAETEHLNYLIPRLSYTDIFKEYFAVKTRLLARALKRDKEFQGDRQRWGELQFEERLQFLDSIFRKMMTVFSDEYFTFRFTMVEILDHENLWGLAEIDESRIHISRNFLSNMDTRHGLLYTLLHEGVHSALTQLALAHRSDRLISHPFMDEIFIADVIRRYGAFGRPAIWEFYKLDAEEVICRSLEEVFFEALNLEGDLLVQPGLLEQIRLMNFKQKVKKFLPFLHQRSKYEPTKIDCFNPDKHRSDA